MTDTGKSYHTSCTGLALETVKAHSAPAEITLFGSCFCPFVQRVWLAFEYLGIDYQVDEVDPYKKPQQLLDVSPRGLVPALKLNKYDPPRAINESTVIIEFLQELSYSLPNRKSQCHLLPPLSDPFSRALCRLQSDHINRTLVPAFYRYLQAQSSPDQIIHGKSFLEAVEKLIELFEKHSQTANVGGLWNGESLGWADVMAMPWLFRATNVLPHYRGFAFPSSQKFEAYMERLLNHPDVKKTCSTEALYLDSYERYAANRPNTSQVAKAINEGKELP
ncbi:glutathione S-transferase [Hysterangium stoloniferum]|nr:glutathione S-transferase [Hysterangium stoloniferum]